MKKLMVFALWPLLAWGQHDVATPVDATIPQQCNPRPYAAPPTASNGGTAVSAIDCGLGQNVIRYGADPTGATDSTMAFNNALSALGSAGGTIMVPPGKYALNLTIIRSNIQIVCEQTADQSTAVSYLQPWSISDAVIRVGNDTGRVSGIAIRNCVFNGVGPNGTGSSGLAIGGGAYRCFYENLTSYNFLKYQASIGPSALHPISHQFFNGLTLDNNNATEAVAAFGVYYGSKYVTAIYVNNANFASTASGYAIEDDSSTINLNNSWIEVGNDNGGIHFLHTYSELPRISANNMEVDGGGRYNVLSVYNANGLASDFIWGNVVLNGYLKESSGVRVSYAGTGMQVPYRSQLNYPVIAPGTSLYFDEAGKNSMYIGSSNLFVNAESNFVVHTHGTTPSIAWNTGDIQIGNTGATAGMNSGFVYIVDCGGTPTGTPTSRPGFSPVCADAAHNKIWLWNGATWQSH